MHELDCQPAPEIARALEIPVNTVYSRLRTARSEFVAAVKRFQAQEERLRDADLDAERALIEAAQTALGRANPNTHAVTWSYLTGPEPGDPAQFRGVQGFPVVDAEGTVYAGAVDHRMYALDKSGVLKWSLLIDERPSESSPALSADGTLYFTAGNGYLYAIRD